MSAPFPADEPERLAALRRYDVLDTLPEPSFDDITFLAACICRAPIATITLIDEHRQWFKSKIGIVGNETPRDIAFCAHTILQTDLLIVNDARADARFATNPLVAVEAGIRFYAGAPLITADGYALGTLCVIDRVAREMNEEQKASLRALSRQVVAQLELRRNLKELRETVVELRRAKVELYHKNAFLEAQVNSAFDGILVVDAQGRNLLENQRLADLWKIPPATGERNGAAASLPRLIAKSGDAREFADKVRHLDSHPNEVSRDEIRVANGPTLERLSAPVVGADGMHHGRIWTFRDVTAYKHTQAVLQESQLRYQALFENMLEGFAYCRLVTGDDELVDFEYLQVNRAFETLTGLKEVVGKNVSEVIPGLQQSNPELLAVYRRVALTGRPEKFETKVKALRLWLSIAVYSHEKNHFAAVFDDITERKDAELSLRLLNSAVLQSTDSVMITDAELDRPGPRIIFVNTAFTVMTGYTAEEIMGKTPRILQGPRTDPAQLKRLRENLSRDEAFHGETINYRKDGTPFDMEWQIAPLRDPGGNVTHFVAIQRDITRRKQAENALQESNEKFHQLADNITDAFWMRSPDMRQVLYISPAFERIWGRSADSLYSNPGQWVDFTLPEDRPNVLAAFTALTEDRPNLEIEYRIVRPDGEIRWIRVRGFQIRNTAGELIRLTGVVTDITAAKQADAELKKTHQEQVVISHQAGMAEVATGILHNVGNVLNSVNVSATIVADCVRHSHAAQIGKLSTLLEAHRADLGDFLVRDPRGRLIPDYVKNLAHSLGEEQTVMTAELDDLRKNIEHIKGIVSMQQSYARASGVLQTLAVTDLIEDALRMNAAAHAPDNLVIRREYHASGAVTTDKHKVLQILINLLRNAKHACEESGQATPTVTVRTTSDAHGIAIAVVDGGIGIPRENLTRIFNHGFTTRKNGHGFGLHSGALAARELGGSLTVESAGTGLGATFVLTLPFATEAVVG